MEGTKKKKKKILHDGIVPKAVAEGPDRGKMVDAQRLPEPGHYRDEILKMRRDQLEAEVNRLASQIAAGASVGSIAKHLGIDREIVKHFDPRTTHIKIKNARHDKVYAWICYDFPKDQKGLAVRKQLTIPGWEVVGDNGACRGAKCAQGRIATCQHEYPEAPDLLQPDGTRKIGDTILMRCDKRTWALREATLRAQRKLRLVGKPMPGKKLPGRVHTDLNDPVMREALKRLGTSNDGLEETLQEGPTDGRLAAEG